MKYCVLIEHFLGDISKRRIKSNGPQRPVVPQLFCQFCFHAESMGKRMCN